MASLFKRITKGTFNYGLGKILPKLIGFFLIPVYTVYLSPSDFGIVELATSLSGFIIPLMRLGVPGAITRFYFDYPKDSTALNDLVTTVYKLLLFSSVCIAIFACFLLYFFGAVLVPGLSFWPYIAIIIISSTLAFAPEIQRRLIIAREQSLYSAKLNLFIGITSISMAVFFVVVLKMEALGLLLSQLITALVFFFQSHFYLKKNLVGKKDRTIRKDVMKYGYGLLPHHMFSAAAPLISRSILSGVKSTSALGIFSISMKFYQPLNLLYASFNLIFQPIYYELRSKPTQENSKKRQQLIVTIWYCAIAIFIVFNLFISVCFKFMVTEDFLAGEALVPILTLGFLAQVLYIIFIIEIFYSKKTKYISLVTSSGLAINILFSVLFVEEYGYLGIAWANTLGFIAWAIMAQIIFYQKSYQPIPYGRIVIGVFIAIASFLIYYVKTEFPVRLLLSLLLLGICYSLIPVKPTLKSFKG